MNAPRNPLPTRPALVDDVYDALNQRLMDNLIPPGGRVTIDVLARELGVSPTPVREALARLESDGLVLKQGLRGYFATPKLTRSEVEEMYDFRLQIEPWAAGRAAVLGDDQGRRRLSDELAEAPPRPLQADYEHLKAMTSHDIRFHDLIMELAANELARQSLQRAHCHLHLFRLQIGRPATTQATYAAVVEHGEIAAGVLSQDGEQADAAMRRHLTESRKRIRQLFQ